MGRSPEWLLFPAAGTDKYSEKQNKEKKTSFNGTFQQTVFYLADLSCVCMCSVYFNDVNNIQTIYISTFRKEKKKEVQYKIKQNTLQYRFSYSDSVTYRNKVGRSAEYGAMYSLIPAFPCLVSCCVYCAQISM